MSNPWNELHIAVYLTLVATTDPEKYSKLELTYIHFIGETAELPGNYGNNARVQPISWWRPHRKSLASQLGRDFRDILHRCSMADDSAFNRYMSMLFNKDEIVHGDEDFCIRLRFIGDLKNTMSPKLNRP